MLRSAHRCALPTSTKFKEESKTWGKKKWLKLAIIKLAALCKWNKRWKIFYQGRADYINDHHYHMNSNYWYILNPYSRFIFVWNFYAFVNIVLYLTLDPVSEFIQSNRGENPIWLYYAYIFTCFIYMDILVTCLRGWPMFDQKIIIFHPGKIFMHYLKSRFLITDVLSAFPLDIYMDYIHQSYSAAELMPMATIIDVLQFFMYIVKLPKLMFYFSEIANLVRLTGNRKRLVRILFLFLITHHVFAGCHLHSGGKGKFQKYFLQDESTWILKMNVEQSPPILLYLIAFWRSLKLTLSGETVHLENMNEMVVSWFNRISSYCWFTLAVVQMNLLKISLDDKYEQFLTYVREFMRNKLVFPHIQRRILNYFMYYIRKGRFIDEENLLHLLPDKLRLEIMAAKCYYLVKNAYLFVDIPEDIMQKMCSELIAEIYLSNDVIIKAGLVGSDMFFIAQGTVKVLTPLGKEMVLLEDGEHFGEVSLILENQKRMASVLAVENCLIYRLKKSTFDKIIKPNEALMELIMKRVDAKIQESLMMDKHKIKFLKEFTLSQSDSNEE